MTNDERKEMYQDWENLLGMYLCSVDHEERVAMLEILLEGIGSRLEYDMTSLLLAIKAYDKEACKPDLVPKVREIYRIAKDIPYKGTPTLQKGDLVRCLKVTDSTCCVQSLMPGCAPIGALWIFINELEEV